MKKKATLEQLSEQTEAIRIKVLKNKKISRYVGKKFADQLKKIYGDFTDQSLGRLDVVRESQKTDK